MNSRRQLITPATRSRITREIHAAGVWTGTRLGFRLKIMLTSQLTLENQRIEYHVALEEPGHPELSRGNAHTVFEAVESIQSVVDHHRTHETAKQHGTPEEHGAWCAKMREARHQAGLRRQAAAEKEKGV